MTESHFRMRAAARGLGAVFVVFVPSCRHPMRDPAYEYSLQKKLRVADLTDRDRAAMIAAFDASGAADRDRAPICLALRTADSTLFNPDTKLLRAFSPGRRVVRRIDCPPTYTTMIYVPGRTPRGYVDPHLITIDVPHFEPSGQATMIITDAQGTGTKTYACRGSEIAVKWRAVCRLIRMEIS